MQTRPLALALIGAVSLMSACGGGSDDDTGNPPLPPPSGLPDFVSCTGTACTISGTVDENFTLTTDRSWTLDGLVKVGNGNVTLNSAADVAATRAAGVTLTIPAGTHVKATDDAVLLVTRGSKLEAQGLPNAPITFSSLDDDFDGEGEWGGVIIQGFAPQYAKGTGAACYGSGTVCNVVGEGGTFVGNYGGNDPADDSGTLRYVRIAEAGLVAGPNNEVNGLTLQGVGHGTGIDFVQVHGNLDDGIEWFGGTVNATHLVLTGNDDDDIDFDEGYKGNIQFAIVRKNPTKAAPTGSNDPRGIEANSGGAEETAATAAAIANVTLIGGPLTNPPNTPREGMLLRGGVTVSVYNSAVSGFSRGCVNIDDGATVSSTVSMVNVIGDCTGNATGIYTDVVPGTRTNDAAGPVALDASWALSAAVGTVTATTFTAVDNGSGFVFQPTTYIGAVAPGTTAATAWWAEWTIPGSLADAAEEPAEAPFVSCTGGTCTISGDVTEDYVLVAGTNWVLDNVVRVGNGNVTLTSAADVTATREAGVTLTVRPGVSVKATEDAVLLVTRGSRLVAEGTANAPITFSSLDDNFDGEGEWGGVIIQGFAPQYAKGTGAVCHGAGTVCNVVGEGGTFVGNYGGNEPGDDSGTLKYVRIAEAGLVAGPNNEVNGLTLQGVGHGTDIEYVQVHGNLDDGIEWFGGTVNARYIVLTSNDDDDIDFDEGYRGNIQYAIVKKNPTKAAPTGSNDPRGIEANSGGAEESGATAAAIANVTIVGGPLTNPPNTTREGVLLRGGVTTALYNSAISGFSRGCVNIDNGATVTSTITLVNVIGDCAGNGTGIFTDLVAGTLTNAIVGPVVPDAAFALPAASATVTPPTITPVNNGSAFAFDATPFIGAVAPGTAADAAWWAGWTIPGSVQ